ncbi:MAG TPA: radical SAM protein [Terriglobales bacterium]|nr:radical SAM protein [Terriglobales bacterium]
MTPSAALPFPSPQDQPPRLVGIARLAAESKALSEGHQVEYRTLDARSLLNRCESPRMPFRWTINPYRGCEFGCHYCYARYTHEFMELRDGRDFERVIYAKQNAAWMLRRDLRQVRAGELIAIGTATDPYQPAERRYGVTRSILEELAQHRGLNLSMVTKSNLILRDVDLLRRLSERNRFSVLLTITTTDATLARLLEPRAPRPDLRLEAVRGLVEAGIEAGVMCAPILPGITDSPQNLENVVRAAANAGARMVANNALFLKPCSLQVFLPLVEEHFPHLASQYRRLYAKRAYLPDHYRRETSQLMTGLRRRYGVDKRRAQSVAYAHERMTEQQLGLF